MELCILYNFHERIYMNRYEKYFLQEWTQQV